MTFKEALRKHIALQAENEKREAAARHHEQMRAYQLKREAQKAIQEWIERTYCFELPIWYIDVWALARNNVFNFAIRLGKTGYVTYCGELNYNAEFLVKWSFTHPGSAWKATYDGVYSEFDNLLDACLSLPLDPSHLPHEAFASMKDTGVTQ